MNDEELVKFVLAFAGEINALQRRYASRLEAEREQSRTAAFLEAYRAEVGLIYARYLTERERTYYTALSVPPTFAAMEAMTLSTVERMNDRAVVEILTSGGLLDYRFKLVCREGEWRINSYQQRLHTESRIRRWIYGDF
nr:hypothetical protein [uncultured Oscillibacter sp.]